MNATEERTIRDVIKRLQGQNAADDVVDALRGPARLYLDSWVIPALELLVSPDRTLADLKLAESLARVPSVSQPLTAERAAAARSARMLRPGEVVSGLSAGTLADAAAMLRGELATESEERRVMLADVLAEESARVLAEGGES